MDGIGWMELDRWNQVDGVGWMESGGWLDVRHVLHLTYIDNIIC